MEDRKEYILKKIQSIYQQNFRFNFVPLKDHLLGDDLSLDALDLIEIASMLEAEFVIRISDESLYSWRTVNDVVETIHKLT